MRAHFGARYDLDSGGLCTLVMPRELCPCGTRGLCYSSRASEWWCSSGHMRFTWCQLYNRILNPRWMRRENEQQWLCRCIWHQICLPDMCTLQRVHKYNQYYNYHKQLAGNRLKCGAGVGGVCWSFQSSLSRCWPHRQQPCLLRSASENSRRGSLQGIMCAGAWARGMQGCWVQCPQQTLRAVEAQGGHLGLWLSTVGGLHMPPLWMAWQVPDPREWRSEPSLPRPRGSKLRQFLCDWSSSAYGRLPRPMCCCQGLHGCGVQQRPLWDLAFRVGHQWSQKWLWMLALWACDTSHGLIWFEMKSEKWNWRFYSLVLSGIGGELQQFLTCSTQYHSMHKNIQT